MPTPHEHRPYLVQLQTGSISEALGEAARKHSVQIIPFSRYLQLLCPIACLAGQVFTKHSFNLSTCMRVAQPLYLLTHTMCTCTYQHPHTCTTLQNELVASDFAADRFQLWAILRMATGCNHSRIIPEAVRGLVRQLQFGMTWLCCDKPSEH